MIWNVPTVCNLISQHGKLPFDFTQHVTMLTEVGSGAHGTKLDPDDPNFIDDTDIFGVVLPPRRLVLGLDSWTHAVFSHAEYDFNLMSWDKFIRLALKSNPNILTTLWHPNYPYLTWPFRELVIRRNTFVSKQVYHSFSGYAHAQVKKMVHLAYCGYMGEKRKHLVDKYGYDCKNAAHAIRLFRMGIEFLRTGDFEVYRADREELKQIKSGKWPMHEVERLVDVLEKEARAALAESKLPDHPDRKHAEKLLLWGYQWMRD